MDKIVSCCGVVCSECTNYPDECKGCPIIEGKPYWLEYTGESVCNIFNCCINQKKFSHCGQCGLLPCECYKRDDPTKTFEENAEDHRKQIEQLRRM